MAIPFRMRSKLFVPGIRPELFSKACAGAADAVSFDLEDSVPGDRKAEARNLVAGFIGTGAAMAAGKVVIVRTNAADADPFVEDVRGCAINGVDLLNLPKIESVADLARAVAVIEQAEASNGVTRPIRLLINIETPRALRAAAQIAGGHPRVLGLQLGLGDLFEPLGIARDNGANVHAAMYQVRLAAAEAGVFACDGAFADFSDAVAFGAEARMARDLGFIGKSCIHPTQVALANEIFQPTVAELAKARRIVDAAQAASAQGRGAFAVDGRMIDPPFLRRAEAVLAAGRTGSDEGTTHASN